MDGLMTIIREAIRHVPAMKYALAVAALAAVVALILGFGVGATQVIAGGAVVLAGMVLLFVFSVLVTINRDALRLPSLVLVWVVMGFAVAGAGVMFWKLVVPFDWPSVVASDRPPAAMSRQPPDNAQIDTSTAADADNQGGPTLGTDPASQTRGVSSNEALAVFLKDWPGSTPSTSK